MDEYVSELFPLVSMHLKERQKEAEVDNRQYKQNINQNVNK